MVLRLTCRFQYKGKQGDREADDAWSDCRKRPCAQVRRSLPEDTRVGIACQGGSWVSSVGWIVCRLTIVIDGKGLCFGAAKLIAMSQQGNHNNEAEAPEGASPDALPVLCTHPATHGCP